MKIEIIMDKSEALHYVNLYFQKVLGLDDVDRLEIKYRGGQDHYYAAEIKDMKERQKLKQEVREE